MPCDWKEARNWGTTLFWVVFAFVMVAMGRHGMFGRYSEIAVATPFVMILSFATCSFIMHKRGDASAVPVLMVREEDDYLEEDEELKEEILRILFPAKPLDEESQVVKGTMHGEGDALGDDKSEFASGGEDGDGGGVQCAICLDIIGPGDLIASGASCDHVYHRPCVFQWLMKKKRRRDVAAEDDEHNSCPTCRRPMWTGQEYEMAETEARENETDTTKLEDQNKKKQDERTMRTPDWAR